MMSLADSNVKSAVAGLCETLLWVRAAQCVWVWYKEIQGHPWTPLQRFCGPIPRGGAALTKVIFGACYHSRQAEKWVSCTQGTGLGSCFPWECRCAQAGLWLCESSLLEHSGGRGLALMEMEIFVCEWRGSSTSGFLCSPCAEQQQLGTLGQKICWFSLFSALALYWRVLSNGDALGYVIPARWLCSVWHFWRVLSCLMITRQD